MRDYRVAQLGGVAQLGSGAAGSVASGLGRGPALPVEFAIARSSTDPALLTRRAVEALGGMGAFISRDDVVAIKPNIGWDRTRTWIPRCALAAAPVNTKYD